MATSAIGTPAIPELVDPKSWFKVPRSRTAIGPPSRSRRRHPARALGRFRCITGGGEGAWMLGGVLANEWKSGDAFLQTKRAEG